MSEEDFKHAIESFFDTQNLMFKEIACRIFSLEKYLASRDEGFWPEYNQHVQAHRRSEETPSELLHRLKDRPMN